MLACGARARAGGAGPGGPAGADIPVLPALPLAGGQGGFIMFDVLCIGETAVDVITRTVSECAFSNVCTPVDDILIQTGGDAMNNAVDLARLGNRVCYAGRIGADAGGQFVLDTLKSAGVDTSHVVRSSLPHTKVNLLIDAHGDRAFFYSGTTSREFTAGDVDPSLLRSCRIVQVGGAFHLPGFDGEGTAALFALAREAGAVTSMDVTNDFTGRWDEIIRPCYQFLDYFLPSVDQAVLISGREDPWDIAGFFLDRGVGHVAVKLGGEGSFYRSRETAFYCGTYDVPVVETTGAGDAFCAGFLTALLHGQSAEECVISGTAASAQVIQAVGASSGMCSYSALQSFIEKKQAPAIRYVSR